jgi:hypothetical protein
MTHSFVRNSQSPQTMVRGQVFSALVPLPECFSQIGLETTTVRLTVAGEPFSTDYCGCIWSFLAKWETLDAVAMPKSAVCPSRQVALASKRVASLSQGFTEPCFTTRLDG